MRIRLTDMFNKIKKIFTKKNLVGLEITVVGAVVVYVIILSGMIKVNSLLTGLVLVGAGVAMIFAEPAVPKYTRDSGENEQIAASESKSIIRSLGILLVQQLCIAGIVIMLILGQIYDNRTDYFGWVLIVFAALLLASTISTRLISKYGKAPKA